jgi:hypothetical protein
VKSDTTELDGFGNCLLVHRPHRKQLTRRTSVREQ